MQGTRHKIGHYMSMLFTTLFTTLEVHVDSRSGNASGGSVDHTLLISNTVTSTQLRVYGFIVYKKLY